MPLMNETETKKLLEEVLTDIKKLLEEALEELENNPLDHDCELPANVYKRWMLKKKLAEYIAKLS